MSYLLCESRGAAIRSCKSYFQREFFRTGGNNDQVKTGGTKRQEIHFCQKAPQPRALPLGTRCCVIPWRVSSAAAAVMRWKGAATAWWQKPSNHSSESRSLRSKLTEWERHYMTSCVSSPGISLGMTKIS